MWELDRSLLICSVVCIYAPDPDTMIHSVCSDADHARYLLLFMPMANICRLACAGLGYVKDPDLIKSLTRTNNVKEVLGGPMLYTVVLALVTLFCWKSSITGILAVSMMCGGDGLADIVGRRIGNTKLPYNPEKSLEGSIAMVAGGSMISFGYEIQPLRLALSMVDMYQGPCEFGLNHHHHRQKLVDKNSLCRLLYFQEWTGALVVPEGITAVVLFTAVTSAIVESLTNNSTVDDNLSVPAAAALSAYLAQSVLGTA